MRAGQAEIPTAVCSGQKEDAKGADRPKAKGSWMMETDVEVEPPQVGQRFFSPTFPSTGENRCQIGQTRELGPLFAICPSTQVRANFQLTLMGGSRIGKRRRLSLRTGLVITPKRLWSW